MEASGECGRSARGLGPDDRRQENAVDTGSVDNNCRVSRGCQPQSGRGRRPARAGSEQTRRVVSGGRGPRAALLIGTVMMEVISAGMTQVIGTVMMRVPGAGTAHAIRRRELSHSGADSDREATALADHRHEPDRNQGTEQQRGQHQQCKPVAASPEGGERVHGSSLIQDDPRGSMRIRCHAGPGYSRGVNRRGCCRSSPGCSSPQKCRLDCSATPRRATRRRRASRSGWVTRPD